MNIPRIRKFKLMVTISIVMTGIPAVEVWLSMFTRLSVIFIGQISRTQNQKQLGLRLHLCTLKTSQSFVGIHPRRQIMTRKHSKPLHICLQNLTFSWVKFLRNFCAVSKSKDDILPFLSFPKKVQLLQAGCPWKPLFYFCLSLEV